MVKNCFIKPTESSKIIAIIHAFQIKHTKTAFPACISFWTPIHHISSPVPDKMLLVVILYRLQKFTPKSFSLPKMLYHPISLTYGYSRPSYCQLKRWTGSWSYRTSSTSCNFWWCPMLSLCHLYDSMGFSTLFIRVKTHFWTFTGWTGRPRPGAWVHFIVKTQQTFVILLLSLDWTQSFTVIFMQKFQYVLVMIYSFLFITKVFIRLLDFFPKHVGFNMSPLLTHVLVWVDCSYPTCNDLFLGSFLLVVWVDLPTANFFVNCEWLRSIWERIRRFRKTA